MVCVYEPGTVIKTKAGHDVLILEAHVMQNYTIDYLISYWKEGIRYQITIPDFELEYISSADLVEVGFHTCLKDTP